MQNRCSVQDCEGTHRALGLCGKHYAAHKRGETQAQAREAKAKKVRLCEQCSGLIPPLRRSGVLYCSPMCKRKAQYEKEKRREGPVTPNPPCTVDGCSTPQMARGLCSKHYNRLRSKGTTDDVRKNARGVCSVTGCNRPHLSVGLCESHYRQKRSSDARQVWKESISDRPCLHCGDPMGMNKRSSAMFCSRKCKEAEHRASGKGAAVSMRSYFKSRYGLTPEQVNEMASGGCQICGTHEWPGRHNRPHVDHDHKTGRVRGILCHECNTGLGKFKDDPEILSKAIAYLAESG